MNQVNQVNQVNSPKLSYRAEIDGLRAIAVVSVILYHAQMVLLGRDWFEGGFIGVDIFFVISGYLITRIILSELKSKGSFSFLNFYERRARRILPMLFVVIFVSIPYAWQKLLPSDFVEYAESILASLFFGSNFFFYFSTTEYGADSALLKPFLHTWSLGVEEQFYLVFPILAIVAFKYFRNYFLTILVGLSLLSILFAELMEVRNADLNFYLPFSRFWELAVGSMLAYRELYYKPSNEGFASKSLPIFGLYLIAYSILFFDAKTPHPSLHTLIPIIGVALIVGFASKDELVGKVLGSKPFVWIGLISYSAYLWHFPIFAFSRMGKDPTNYDKFEWIALTLILSVSSYFLIEKPFRNRTKLLPKNAVSIILVLFLVLSVFGFMGRGDGFINRYDNSIVELLSPNFYKKSDKYVWEKKKQLYSNEFLGESDSSALKVLVIGDSNSGDFINAVTNSSIGKTWSIVSKRISADCVSYYLSQAELQKALEKHKKSSQKNRCINEHSKTFKNAELFEAADAIIFASNWRESQVKYLRQSNRELVRRYGDKFFYVGTKGSGNTKEYIKKLLLSNVGIKAIAEGVYKPSDKARIRVNVKFKTQLGDKFLDWNKIICLENECPIFVKNFGMYLYDGFHLSQKAAERLGSSAAFEELLLRVSAEQLVD